MSGKAKPRKTGGKAAEPEEPIMAPQSTEKSQEQQNWAVDGIIEIFPSRAHQFRFKDIQQHKKQNGVWYFKITVVRSDGQEKTQILDQEMTRKFLKGVAQQNGVSTKDVVAKLLGKKFRGYYMRQGRQLIVMPL